MEPEGSLTYSQVPATCSYPEPTPSSPHDPLQLPQNLNIILPLNDYYKVYMVLPLWAGNVSSVTQHVSDR
jgi:hypothetical protein